MPELPRISGIKAAAALRRLGFADRHQRGSHLVMVHPDGRRVVVPQHGGHDLKTGTLRSLLREAGIDIKTFREAL